MYIFNLVGKEIFHTVHTVLDIIYSSKRLSPNRCKILNEGEYKSYIFRINYESHDDLHLTYPFLLYENGKNKK